MITDLPTKRLELHELAPEQQELLLEQIRERRLAPLRVYEELVSKKKEVNDEKLRAKADRLAGRIAKQIEVADAAYDKAHAMIRDAKAILLEIGDA